MIEYFRKFILTNHLRTTNSKLFLTEPNTKPTNFKMTIQIIDAPTDNLLIGIPQGGKILSGMLRSIKDFKKSCDYLLLIQNNNSLDVYFIELKTSLDLNADGVPEAACNQIIYTTPFLDYIISMIKVHRDQESIVNRHFVVIADRADKRIDKQSVKPIRPYVCKHRKRKFQVIHSTSIIPFAKLKIPDSLIDGC